MDLHEKVIFPTVFISHSSRDIKLANDVFYWLSDQGFPVWLDKYELFLGQTLKEELYKGIKNSDYVILLISEDSVMSKWVKFETEAALLEEKENMKMKIIPIVIGEVKIPRKLRSKIYLNIEKFDYKKIEPILDTLFQNYYIMRINLDENFDLDFEEVSKNIETYFRMNTHKPVIIRIINNNFIERLIEYLKNHVKNLSLDQDAEKDLMKDIEVTKLELRIILHSLSIILTNLLKEIERVW